MFKRLEDRSIIKTLVFLCALVPLLATLVAGVTPAKAREGSRSLIVEQDVDYFGFDLKTLKKVSLDRCKSSCLKDKRCRAFTYNVKARFCFLKSDFATPQPFVGAVSGKVVTKSAEPELGAAPKLRFVTSNWLSRARNFETRIVKSTKLKTGASGHADLLDLAARRMDEQNYSGAVAPLQTAIKIKPDDTGVWNDLSIAYGKAAQKSDDKKYQRTARNGAVLAAINGYHHSRYRMERAEALALLGDAYKETSWPREAMSAYKASLEYMEMAAVREAYTTLRAEHGFRLKNHSVDAESASPRICLQFSEDLKKDYGDFARFIRVNQQPPKALKVTDRQICASGLAHGQTYQIDVREGLPAENGEVLLTNSMLELYVRDRAASMRFTGNNYVLPASGQRGIPLVSINSDEAKLRLYRVSDRSLAGLLRGSKFLRQLSLWQVEDLVSSLGSPLWKGKMAIKSSLNKEVMTSIPIDEALPERQPGLYLMTAAPDARDLDDYASLASQWFVISDIGLTTYRATGAGVDGHKNDDDLGGLQVFARSLKSAEPLAGIAVELIARNNDVLAKGTTDDQGMVSFDAGLVRGTSGLAPAVLTAQRDGNDFVFLDLTRPGFDLSDRGVTGRPSPSGIDLYAWTERGVYRPGEVVHVSALARDSGARAVSDIPLTFIFTRPDGVEAQRLVGSGKALGGYAVSLPLTSNAMRGTWRVALHTDTGKPALVEQMFLVEDFLPDRTDFTLTPDSTVIKAGKTASATIEGRYLYGAPAQGLTLAGDVRVRMVRERPGFKGYKFGLAEEDDDGAQYIKLTSSGPLDEAGKGSVSFTLDQLMATTRPQKAEMVVRMREANGRAVERRTSFEIEPATTMIGIRPHFDGDQVSEQSNAEFSLIAVDPKGKQIGLAGTDWSLVKIEHHYQWYREDGRWRFESVDLERQVANGTIDLDAKDAANLSLPVDWGSYRLVLEADNGQGGDGALTSSLDFYAGWRVTANSLDTPDGLELALDKQSYKAGETARLNIAPRFAGKLQLALGTDRIVKVMSVDVPETGTSIDIPVEKDWGAGVYVLATLYRPSDYDAGRNPARAIGVKWLAVEPEERALSITLGAPEQNRPHEQLDVPVAVEGLKPGEEAYVTVALVDVGILNLTGYKTPDPVDRYFGQRMLGVDIHDLYGRLIEGYRGVSGALRTGGDGGGPQMKSQGNKPTQELVAFFSGIVKLDADGKGTVAFDIPQFNGSARLMAVAWSKDAVGGVDEETIIRDPIVISASLPKVLAPGDESRLLIELMNKDADEGTYHFSLEASGGLMLGKDMIEQDLTLDRDKMVRLAVPLTAEAAGVGEVVARLSPLLPQDKAEGDAASVAAAVVDEASEGTPQWSEVRSDLAITHRIAVSVRPAQLPVTTKRRIKLASKGDLVTIGPELLTGFEAQGSKLAVSVARPGLYDVPSLLMQLDRYPYGCAEQVTSKALPLLYASELMKGLPEGIAAISSEEMSKRINTAIQKLLSYQNSSGGFSLWGGYRTEPWLSAYVTDFLTRAREKGYEVPGFALRDALRGLRNDLSYRSDLKRDVSATAYGLYVLARNRMASAGDLRFYAETKLDAFASPLARAHLASALALYGDRNRAESVMGSALDLIRRQLEATGQGEDSDFTFTSRLRDLSAMVALSSEITPALASHKGLVSLARAHYDPERRTNTQEQAWMLLAARANKDANNNLALAVNGTPHRGAFHDSLDGEVLDDITVSIALAGKGPVEALITTEAVPDTPLPAGGNGYTISRSYHYPDGSPADIAQVQQNERLVVVVTARQITPMPARLIISDLLPGGFEVENPSLVVSANAKAFDWLPKTSVAHVEFRDDRVVAAIDRKKDGGQDFAIAYSVRAVTPGSYILPPAVIEDMYRPDMSARTASGFMTVTAP